MFDAPFFNTPTFTWIVLPILIFCARICDVSIGTIRVIFVARGIRWYALILAFFEVLIWLMAIGQIMKHLDNFMCYIAYACGYATGTYIGIWLEEKVSLGKVIIRVITRQDASNLVDFLREKNLGVTSVDAEGGSGKVKLLFSIIRRQDLPWVVEQIKQFNPNAFYSVEDVRFVTDVGFPTRHSALADGVRPTGSER